MDVLYFLKLLRPTTNILNPKELNQDADFVNAKSSFSLETHDYAEEDEEEDSFFELELAVNGVLVGGGSKPKVEPKQSLPKRKILPIEQPISSANKPNQSPISILKSAPRFRILAFKKSKSMPAQKTEEEEKESDTASSKSLNLGRNNSLRKQIRNETASELEDDTASSRRFPKEIVHKYLKLINPLYFKVKRSECERMKFAAAAGEFSSYSSATSSPVTGSPTKKEKQGNGIHAGIREVCKHLRKSKSAGASQPPPTAGAGQRRDDSLLLQADGIQSAILHCKRSFNSSRDSSLLSRFASEPLPERMSMDSNDELIWN